MKNIAKPIVHSLGKLNWLLERTESGVCFDHDRVISPAIYRVVRDSVVIGNRLNGIGGGLDNGIID